MVGFTCAVLASGGYEGDVWVRIGWTALGGLLYCSCSEVLGVVPGPLLWLYQVSLDLATFPGVLLFTLAVVGVEVSPDLFVFLGPCCLRLWWWTSGGVKLAPRGALL